MQITDFDFDLPEELIAQEALAERAGSRMLRVARAAGSFTDGRFSELPRLLKKGDTLVLNNTKVFPARLFGATATGARVEIFLVRETAPLVWETLARPARRLKPGKRLDFGPQMAAEVLEKTADGRVLVRFEPAGDFDEILETVGKTPLPPYIRRAAEAPDADRARYQTVYAKSKGSIAAPTAGLHFTPEILEELRAAGVELAEITLHVGYGTFEPVRVEELAEHRVLPENYEISAETAEHLNRARAERRRIIAVGTTSTRTLETAAARHGAFRAETASADLTITPGYKFAAIDGLLTNFHLPQSSLLVLVSTFGGHELIMDAYRHAVAEKYRFYSYGDCMLVI